ncbi:DUF7017 domain-containing protein [Alteromonas sp. AMM-1]|uniref:DUF7017 domain-containing protein n=1 Tax=Alteromonas sp. AMM-1 TaxID=3394233 RepID=UPI0039A6BCCF
MVTSKDVFAKRKEGQLDEAYSMALQLMNAPNPDDWDIKAFGWCLIDLIKREANSGNPQYLNHYKQQLESITGPALDEVLAKGKEYALSLCNPNAAKIREATQLSKNGQYEQSIAIYKQLIDTGETDQNVATSLAWDIYKRSKELLAQSPVIFGKIKQYLKWYLMLNVEKPSLLHSLILQIANKCASENNFDMLAFSRYWGLENLRDEDFESFKTDDGTTIPSLAERVFIQAAKDGISKNDSTELTQFLPLLETAIKRLPESIWLIQNKVKILLCLNRSDEAHKSAMVVVKEKSRDYWAWELIGDIFLQSDPQTAFACYCKALTCNNDINFTSKVRLKLVGLLIEKKQFAEAKHEVSTIKVFRENASQKVPDEVSKYASSEWFSTTEATETNQKLYNQYAGQAEELLYSDISWTNANLGERFPLKDKPGKFKRKLYVNTGNKCIETSVPNTRFRFDNLAIGCGLQVKGEFDSEGRFQVYAIAQRESESDWDAIPEQIGVVDHINRNKRLFHFIVDKTCDGVIRFDGDSAGYKEGDSIALKLAEFTNKREKRYSVLSHSKTVQQPSSNVMQHFTEDVRVDNGMGFTTSGIFIPPPLISQYGIKDDDLVSGLAIINFNEKRGVWGWKAFDIKSVEQGDL